MKTKSVTRRMLDNQVSRARIGIPPCDYHGVEWCTEVIGLETFEITTPGFRAVVTWKRSGTIVEEVEHNEHYTYTDGNMVVNGVRRIAEPTPGEECDNAVSL